ncbi:hypothetical protein [Streptomyces sp. NPDC054765]
MVLFLAARPVTSPPVRPAPRRARRRSRAPLRLPGLAPLLLTFLCTGAVFGSLEVVTVAFADAHGIRSAAGGLPALQAAGSCAAAWRASRGLVQSRTPADRLNEGMTPAVTALLSGIAAGSAAGGWSVEHPAGPGAAYGVPAAAALAAFATTALTTRARSGTRRDEGAA